jgi:hypothetical protein
MTITNKLLPVALIAALIGGSMGALVMYSRTGATPQADSTATATPQTTGDQAALAGLNTPSEQSAYKTGFADGYHAAGPGVNNTQSRVVYRNAKTVRRSSNARRVYYDYSQPRGRSFWQKHRDKLTLGIGTGAGAAIGALIGGKKGAAIGALSGAGGSALYTYKLRKRH